MEDRKEEAEAVSILSLATADAAYPITQEDYIEWVIQSVQLTGEIAEGVRKLGARSAIERRYFCVNDAQAPPSEWQVLPKDFPQSSPSMTVRNKTYCREAPKLAIAACKKAVAEWGGDPAHITHVISVSCTGVMAPGLEFHVMEALGIPRNVQRLGINIMGCFGAFRGIATAKAFARENPMNRVLLFCTELCSIHFQTTLSFETMIGNALFGDGAAALIIGSNVGSVHDKEKALWHIEDTASFILEHTPDLMTWEASDVGFIMKLSAKIPDSLKEHTPSFVQKLLGNRCLPSECGWAIHPGGKAIVKGLEEVLNLQPWQTACSWDVLKNYGNMSSVTFLYVLDNLRKKNVPVAEAAPWTIGVGFGPGLALEAVLLKTPFWRKKQEEQQQPLVPEAGIDQNQAPQPKK
ncbi:Type III polyketide synthase [Balamuthia mandrillaris]